MQTVAELASFRRQAEEAGMSEEDIRDLVDFLAANPDAGEEIVGTSGCRKVRFAIRGNNKGKSGGVRTITLFSGPNIPVFLLAVFAKNRKVTLTKAERNALQKLSGAIVDGYAKRVHSLAAGEKA